jgi:hypothetical protein
MYDKKITISEDITNSILMQRRKKENKSVVFSLRLTESEQNLLEGLKSDLKFDSMAEMLLFCSEVVERLKTWKKEGYTFVLMKPEKEECKEVSFEFEPFV